MINGQHQKCWNNGGCTYKFPLPTKNPEMRKDCIRFAYFCRRECDRYTPAYHAALSLLCDAHVNVLRVIREEFVKYMLTYASKRNPSGCVLPTLPFKDAFPNVEPLARDIALRLVQVTPWSANEETLFATNTSVFATSAVISRIDASPPHMRRMVCFAQHGQGNTRADSHSSYECRPDFVVNGCNIREMCYIQFWRVFKDIPVNDMKKL